VTPAPFDLVAAVAPTAPMAELRSFRLTGRRKTHRLAADRWFMEPGADEWEVLAMAAPPVLDVGCGPGRHTVALGRRGVAVMGIDVAPGAVAVARRRGGAVTVASVFDRLPFEGGWGSALLMDGNIGIGGDPEALLRRVHTLLRPGGRLLLETLPLGEPTMVDVVRVHGSRGASEPFAWAVVGADSLPALAAKTGFRLASMWPGRGRWFARLDAI
jgi:SAM-dependent methyltransferase